MQIVVLINGYGGSGKDTFIEIFSQESPWPVRNLSTIYPVNAALQFLGWDGITKDWQYRRFASEVKRVWKEYNDGPVKYIQTLIEQNSPSFREIVFVHTREIAEIMQFQRIFPRCTTLLVRRPGVKITSNASDIQVNNMKYEHIIDNGSEMSDLVGKAQNLWNALQLQFGV